MALIRYFKWHRLHVSKGNTPSATDLHTQLSMSSPSQARTPSRSRERGAEILEFAFVLGALLALMLGIFSFARAYEVYGTITRAAREGARMAVLPSSIHDGNTYIDGNQTSVTQANSLVFSRYITPALTAANLDPEAVIDYSETIGWLDPSDADPQCGVTISFKYPYQFSIPFLGQGLGTVDIPTSVQMRRENQSTTGSCP